MIGLPDQVLQRRYLSETKQNKGKNMTNDIYKYHFDESIPGQEMEDTFMLAMLAVESLHGVPVRGWRAGLVWTRSAALA